MATSLEEVQKKVGQLFFVGIPSAQLDSEVSRVLATVGVGGVIHFKHNYESLEQLIELNTSIQKKAQSFCYNQAPVWIGVDQEGGRVQRFKDPFTIMPPLAKWGAINSPKTVFEAGFVLAQELKVCGVTVNFAPVVDVLQLEAKAIGDRAFSSDPQMVASLGSAVVRGLQKGGVLAVAKHFPGHGGVEADSHLELPVSQKDVKELEDLDWIPFRRVVRSRCEGIMVAHILHPKIDPSKPASLSRKFLQDHLRKSLRFQKLIFTDDLEMGAVVQKYDLKEAAFLAVEAGHDQLILGHKWDQIEDIWAHLVKAFYDGVLPMSRLDESIQRIQDAKKRYLAGQKPLNLADARALVGCDKFKKIAAAIAAGHALDPADSVVDSDEE